jgi:hypothetical protein
MNIFQVEGGAPLNTPYLRVPHPFAFFAKGWESTNPTPVYNANNQLTQWAGGPIIDPEE